MGHVSSSNNNKRAKAAESLPPPKKQDPKSNCSKELIGKIMVIAGLILLAAGLSTIIASSINGVNYFAVAAKFIGTTPTIFSCVVWSVSGAVTVIGIALVYCKTNTPEATALKTHVKKTAIKAATPATSKQVNGNPTQRKAQTGTATATQSQSGHAGQTKAGSAKTGSASTAAQATPPPLSDADDVDGADGDHYEPDFDDENASGTNPALTSTSAGATQSGQAKAGDAWDDFDETSGTHSASASSPAAATHSAKARATDGWDDFDLGFGADASGNADAGAASAASSTSHAAGASLSAASILGGGLPATDDGSWQNVSVVPQPSSGTSAAATAAQKPPAPDFRFDVSSLIPKSKGLFGASAAATEPSASTSAPSAGNAHDLPDQLLGRYGFGSMKKPASAAAAGAPDQPHAQPPALNTAQSSPDSSIDAVPVVSGTGSANSSLGAPLPAGHLALPPPPAAQAKPKAAPPPRGSAATPHPRKATEPPAALTGSLDDSGTVAAASNPKPQQTGGQPSPVIDPSFFVRPGAQKSHQIQAGYADMAADLERLRKQAAQANAASGTAAPGSPPIARSSPYATAAGASPAPSVRGGLLPPLQSKHRPDGAPPAGYSAWKPTPIPRASIGRGKMSGNTLGFEARPLNAGDASNAAAPQPTIADTGAAASAAATVVNLPAGSGLTKYAKTYDTKPDFPPQAGNEWVQLSGGKKWIQMPILDETDSESPSQTQQPVQQTSALDPHLAAAAAAAPNAYDTIKLTPPLTPPQDGYKWTWGAEHGQWRQVPLTAEASSPSPSAAAAAPQPVTLASGAVVIQMPPES